MLPVSAILRARTTATDSAAASPNTVAARSLARRELRDEFHHNRSTRLLAMATTPT